MGSLNIKEFVVDDRVVLMCWSRNVVPVIVTDQGVPKGRPFSPMVKRYSTMLHCIILLTELPDITTSPEYVVALNPGSDEICSYFYRVRATIRKVLDHNAEQLC